MDPDIFRVWLKILKRVPNSVLWLLKFPAAGEPHITKFAREVAGEEIAQRILFTGMNGNSKPFVTFWRKVTIY